MRTSRRLGSLLLRAGTLAPVIAGLCLVAASAQTTPSAAPPAVPQPPPATRLIVVLDAAHGGDDIGARLNGESEKELTLALSVRLRSLLAARGFQVVTTRESDATVDDNRRAEIADRSAALACLSLHASETGSGIHLFASSLAPAAPTRMPAWKTAQAAWMTRSLAMAGVLNSALLHAGLPVTLGRMALPAVDSMTCPALAIEVAPLPAKEGGVATKVDDPGYLAQVAGALSAAMLEWKTEAHQPETRQTEVHQP